MSQDTSPHTPVSKPARLAALPLKWPEDLLPEIQGKVIASGRKVVVLDDDPTGTQTVHGIPVLTTWSLDALLPELQSETPCFYVLTNSRSLPLSEALALNREIGTNLKAAAAKSGVEIEVVSRSDSTLRGYFPDEVDALAGSLGLQGFPYLVIPFFLEGGRYTIDDVHYVAEGDQLIPAAGTPYAQDAVFGYRNSNLRAWVEEKTKGRISQSQIRSITIDDIRLGGPGAVEATLSKLDMGSACVINAASYRDMEVFVMGLLAAEEGGCKFLLRTAASFVRVRAGIAPRSLLQREDLMSENDHGGLFVVGSYVPKSTTQVEALIDGTSIDRVEVNVNSLLDDSQQSREITRVTESVDKSISQGLDVVLFTSRDLVTGGDDASNLEIGERVSESLVEIIRGLVHQPRYLVAKGGITASDLATKALDIRRAIIQGQILPGVPVWQPGEGSRYPGMPYIVFPGNVGDENALVQINKELG